MNGRDVRNRAPLCDNQSIEMNLLDRNVREKKSDAPNLQSQGTNSQLAQRRNRSSSPTYRNKPEKELRQRKNNLTENQMEPMRVQNTKADLDRIAVNNSCEDNEDNSRGRVKLSADAIAEILQALHQFRSRNNQLYYFNEVMCCWEMLEPSLENRELRALIPKEQRSSIYKNSLSEVYEWLIIDSPELETNSKSKLYLNFRDCSINWKTERIVTDLNERRKLNFLYYIDVDYQSLDKNLDYYQEFTDFVFGDDAATRKEFNKFIGLALSEFRNLKMALFLFGPSNSGKSVVLNLLKLLVGKHRCSSVSFSQLGENFALTRLLGKRLNVSGEVSGTGNKKIDVFKSLTGNDDIEISYKSRDYFTYINECMFVFACNNYPDILSVPEFDSYLSRIFFFPFENVKNRDEWVDGLECKLYEDAYSVIKAAMQGLRDLADDNYCFAETEKMKKCKLDYRAVFDSFTLFADKHIVTDTENKVSSKEIRMAYSQFCSLQEYKTLDVNVWSQILKQKYQCISCTMNVVGNDGYTRRERAYKGIRLCAEDENSDDNTAGDGESNQYKVKKRFRNGER